MALKAVLAKKADVDALPEAQRSLYKETDGRFILDVEGMVLDEDHGALNTKLAEFRDKNIKLLKDLDKYKDVDPDKYRQTLTELEQLKAKGIKPDEMQAAIAAAVEKATGPITERLTAMQTERDNAKKALDKKELDDALWKVGMASGVRDEAKEFWLAEASKVFRRDDKGNIAAFNGDQQMFSARRGKATELMTAEEWALEVAPKSPSLAILYKDSKGGGAQNQLGNLNGAKVLSRESGEAISGSLEEIAKGTVVVQ